MEKQKAESYRTMPSQGPKASSNFSTFWKLAAKWPSGYQRNRSTLCPCCLTYTHHHRFMKGWKQRAQRLLGERSRRWKRTWQGLKLLFVGARIDMDRCMRLSRVLGVLSPLFRSLSPFAAFSPHQVHPIQRNCTEHSHVFLTQRDSLSRSPRISSNF